MGLHTVEYVAARQNAWKVFGIRGAYAGQTRFNRNEISFKRSFDLNYVVVTFLILTISKLMHNLDKDTVGG